MVQAATAGITLPSRYLVSGMAPHLSQIGGTCTTFGSASMKRWQEKRDGNGVRNYNNLRMYSWQKQIDGIQGEGSTGRSWCQVAKNRGLPLAGQSSAVDKIAGYWNVDLSHGDIDVLKAAIMAFGPVTVSMTFPSNWIQPVKGVVLKPNGYIAGGHLTCWVGWDDNLPGVGKLSMCHWNSWGDYPGSTGGGNFWVPVDYYALDGNSADSHKAAIWEVWKTKDIIGD
jgi:hypothetical protein